MESIGAFINLKRSIIKSKFVFDTAKAKVPQLLLAL